MAATIKDIFKLARQLLPGDRIELGVLAAIFVVSPDKVLLSVLGAVMLNLVLAINHRADRYVGVS